MIETINSKQAKKYDLEDRTLKFALDTKKLIKNTKRTFDNLDYLRQLLRCSSSVGANFIEANESLSKKDFVHRIKIYRKEAKESNYWFNLLEDDNNLSNIEILKRESKELQKIFGAIIEKCK